MLSASARLLRLLSLLQTRRHWAGAELAEQLAVHPRTLRRDIGRLRQLGYFVIASSGIAGGYTLQPRKALPPLLLEDDEALAVALALRTAISGTVAGIGETALRALVKLEQTMPESLRRRGDALRCALVLMERTGPTVDAPMLAALAGACRDQLRVSYAYADGHGNRSLRTCEPHGVVYVCHRWYLVAWDLARADWRTFRIDRIVGKLAVESHFLPRAQPDGGDLRAFVSRSLAVAPYAQQARVILHAPHEAMARRIPPSAGRLEALDDERCVLECGAPTLDALAYGLMALEVDFEVLTPSALADHLRRAGERLARSLSGAPTARSQPAVEMPK